MVSAIAKWTSRMMPLACVLGFGTSFCRIEEQVYYLWERRPAPWQPSPREPAVGFRDVSSYLTSLHDHDESADCKDRPAPTGASNVKFSRSAVPAPAYCRPLAAAVCTPKSCFLFWDSSIIFYYINYLCRKLQ